MTLLLILAACRPEETPKSMPDVCEVDEVPDAATARFGWQDDGSFVEPGGRLVVPAGPSVLFDGMPTDIVTHPTLPVAYVTVISADFRRLLTLDLDSLEVVQALDQDHNAMGLVVAPDGETLWSAGGAGGTVDQWSVASDGTLEAADSIAVGSTVAGLTLSDDGATLWASSLSDGVLSEIDVATAAVTRLIPVTVDGWGIVGVPGRDEVVLSALTDRVVSIVDLASGSEAAALDVGAAPAGLASDGTSLWVALSNGDAVAKVDLATRAVVAEADVTEHDLLDDAGKPLRNSNVNNLWLDGDRLYVTRGTDNAVSVLDADTLEVLGSFPTAKYPNDAAGTADGRIVVSGWRGGGIGPGGGAKGLQRGALSVIDLDGLDLATTTADVEDQATSAADTFPYTCDGTFPVPTVAGQDRPIRHVVLVVKENKTLDCLFGDMGEDLPGLDADPSEQSYPADATPNMRALMRQFNVSDNFYTNALESDSGHLMLTAAHLTQYAEWMWMESSYDGTSFSWPIDDPSEPAVGNFLTHVLENGLTLRSYGEIVGMFLETSDGRTPMEYSDLDYPGGPVFNIGVSDVDKANYLAEEIARDGLADFTYISLPNDHTFGTDIGRPTPDSMVADNDEGLGILIDAISHSPDWESTAVFILQDDPQGCGDHVDASRSALVVVSPWAKHGGYVSHTHADYFSVFNTMERMLGLPPLGRPDAAAAPPWDLFQGEPDLTPFDAIPRVLEEDTNTADAVGAEESEQLDFSGPDRNPELGAILDAWGDWRMGRASKAEAQARLAKPDGAIGADRWERAEEESEEETTATERAWRQYEEWSARRGLPAPVKPLSRR